MPESDDGVIVARGLLGGHRPWSWRSRARSRAAAWGRCPRARSRPHSRWPARLGARQADLPVLLLETGGVRLQEANLGEAVVAEIHAEIIALRRHVPVIGVITGMVGCFGGMSITAGLCSYLVVFPSARLELNGPEVIEQEAGIDELDASDKQLIWSLMGGEQRYETGFVDALIEDDAERSGKPSGHWRRVVFLPGIAASGSKSTGAAWRKLIRQRRRRSALRRLWSKGEMQ